MKNKVIKVLILLLGLCTIGTNHICLNKSPLQYLIAFILGIYVYFLFRCIDRGTNISKQYKMGISMISLSILMLELLLIMSTKL